KDTHRSLFLSFHFRLIVHFPVGKLSSTNSLLRPCCDLQTVSSVPALPHHPSYQDIFSERLYPLRPILRQLTRFQALNERPPRMQAANTCHSSSVLLEYRQIARLLQRQQSRQICGRSPFLSCRGRRHLSMYSPCRSVRYGIPFQPLTVTQLAHEFLPYQSLDQ